MWRFSFEELWQHVERMFDKQKRFNQQQTTELDDLKRAGQDSLIWVDNLTTAQTNNIRDLQARCTRLESCNDTAADERHALEARVEALERLLGVKQDEHNGFDDQDGYHEHELFIPTTNSAYEQRPERIQAGISLSGQSAETYQVNEDVGPARSSNKKVSPGAPHKSILANRTSQRKLADFLDRRSEERYGVFPTTVASGGVWTYKYKLYVEGEGDLVRVRSDPLIDAWVEQCNRWSGINPNWQHLTPSKTCMNSMLSMCYASMVEGPEDARSFACHDCERSRTICVVFDSEQGLLRLLPRENVLQSGNCQVTDLATFVNTTESSMQSYQE